DVAECAFHRRTNVHVGGDGLARRRSDLQVGDLLAVLRPAGQEQVHGLDAFGQALGIVEPVDADDQLVIRLAVGNGRDVGVLRVPARVGGELARVDTDRYGVGLDDP